jgi:poly(3-hydroxybutyrate) depolymerase
VHRGVPIDLGAITDTALLAVEGERDDISGIGQTKAALKLAHNLPEANKRYLLAEGVGHYGIFNGSKWRAASRRWWKNGWPCTHRAMRAPAAMPR